MCLRVCVCVCGGVVCECMCVLSWIWRSLFWGRSEVRSAFKKKLLIEKGCSDCRERETGTCWEQRSGEGAGYISGCISEKCWLSWQPPPWIWAPAEVTNVQRCQFVWDYASRAPRVEVDTWGGQKGVLLKSRGEREREKESQTRG